MPTSFLKAFLVGAFAALGVASGFSIEAKAMDVNQCMSSADFKAQRLAEAQKILILANQSVTEPERKDVGTFVLADREGGTAYVVQSDKPYTEPANTICVIRKIYNAHVNFDKDIPVQLLEGTDALIAKNECDALVLNGTVGNGNCHALEDVMARGQKAGYRTLIWGTQADGVKLIVNAKVSEAGEPAGDDVPGPGLVTLSTVAGATVAERPVYQTRLNNEAFKNITGK